MSEQRIVPCAKCQYPNTVDIPKEKPSRWDTWGKFLTIVIAAGSLAMAALVALSPTETTDIGKARAFLGSYYGNASYEPAVTWKRLSSSYKENGKLSQPALTYQGYKSYFEQFKVITVSNVANYDGKGGEWYAADVYRLNKNGDSATTRYAYQLQCPWYTKLPRISCSPNNIQIVNVCVVEEATGRCREDEAVPSSPE